MLRSNSFGGIWGGRSPQVYACFYDFLTLLLEGQGQTNLTYVIDSLVTNERFLIFIIFDIMSTGETSKGNKERPLFQLPSMENGNFFHSLRFPP